MDDLIVLVLLFLVEGGEFGLVVDEFLGVELVALFVLLDAVNQIREVEVLLLDPVDDFDVVVGVVVRLVLLQLLVLPPQVLQVLLYTADRAHRFHDLLLYYLVVLHYLPVDHLQELTVRLFYALHLPKLPSHSRHTTQHCLPGRQHDVLQLLAYPNLTLNLFIPKLWALQPNL